ncbi:MAG: hypothetical protein FJ267_09745 [Planctomycetes bacterium]|nr:hypothetical protein [Planctomycetota bacterium]
MMTHNLRKIRLPLIIVALIAAGVCVNQTMGQTSPAINIFHGTYKGGYWGSVAGVGPYGGAVSATISTAGKITITLPGAGTGTVNPTTGGYTATGKLTVKGQAVNVSYTGSLKPIRATTSSPILAVVGKGTWKVTTAGVTANGSWLVERTATTP